MRAEGDVARVAEDVAERQIDVVQLRVRVRHEDERTESAGSRRQVADLLDGALAVERHVERGAAVAFGIQRRAIKYMRAWRWRCGEEEGRRRAASRPH